MQTSPTSQMKSLSVDRLREYQRMELSAVETYELALKRVTHVGLHQSLNEIHVSHARRAELLGERIAHLGGQPQTSSGIWGAFVKAVQTGADLLGERAMIAALESGEDRAIELYSLGAADCDDKTQRLLAEELEPEQKRTHDLCRTLKQYLQAPS